MRPALVRFSLSSGHCRTGSSRPKSAGLRIGVTMRTLSASRPAAVVSQNGGLGPGPDEQIATNASQLFPYGRHNSKSA
jgi:hypothetical protein